MFPLIVLPLKTSATDPDTCEKHLRFLSRYLCKKMPSSWQKVVYARPLCITMLLPLLLRYFGGSTTVRSCWNTPNHRCVETAKDLLPLGGGRGARHLNICQICAAFRGFLPWGPTGLYAPFTIVQSPKAGQNKAGRSDFRNQRFEPDTGKMRKVPRTQKNNRRSFKGQHD